MSQNTTWTVATVPARVEMEPGAVAPRGRVYAIVPAAGVGARLGAATPKQYLPLAARSVLDWSVAPLLRTDWIDCVVVVVAPGDTRASQLLGAHPRLVIRDVGGAERRDSVLAGIESLGADLRDDDWVLVHDAARPGLSDAALERLRDVVAGEGVGGLLALPVADTVKRSGPPAGPVDQRHAASGTIARDGLWLAQTPQMFRASALRNALRSCATATDEASAIESAGGSPLLVPGERRNFKITTAEDLEMMASLLDAPAGGADWRTGQGWDVHALVPGRRLVIGGVTIPHSHGLLGHSDADVLLHAVIDALLGAAALGDIGRHFPDSDPRWRGADSRALLRAVAAMLRERQWSIANVDATVIAQVPKLAPHIPGMVSAIAEDLGVAADRVNVKAKTSERLGYAGRGEGISAQAAVLLRR